MDATTILSRKKNVDMDYQEFDALLKKDFFFHTTKNDLRKGSNSLPTYKCMWKQRSSWPNRMSRPIIVGGPLNVAAYEDRLSQVAALRGPSSIIS
jgi:hypothetical protein